MRDNSHKIELELVRPTKIIFILQPTDQYKSIQISLNENRKQLENTTK